MSRKIEKHSLFHIRIHGHAVQNHKIRPFSCHDLGIQLFQGILPCHRVIFPHADLIFHIDLRVCALIDIDRLAQGVAFLQTVSL